MDSAGFSYELPRGSAAFACGDGNSCEASPIGYYRFHFWRNDEHPKEHENWIANTDVTGPMCISIVEDVQPNRRKYYRFLVRTVFGTKSVIIFEDDLEAMFGSQKMNRMRLVGAALRVFIEDERDRICALEDEFGAMSIRTNCSVISVSEALVRHLPSSRLRDAPVVNSGVNYRSGGSVPQVGPAASELHLERASSLRKRSKEVLKANPFDLAKSFTQVKDRAFSQILLDLERSFDPTVCHFDIIVAEGSSAKQGQQDEAWRWFSEILGRRLTKQDFKDQSGAYLSKCGRIPSDALNKTAGRASEETRPVRLGQADNLRHHLVEFTMVEWSSAQKLHLFLDYFLDGTKTGLRPHDAKQLFEGIERVSALQDKILHSLAGLDARQPIKQSVVEELVDSGRITSGMVAEELTALCRDHFLDVYGPIVGDLELRIQRAKELLASNEQLRLVEEIARQDPRSGNNSLDGLLSHFFQHPPRYETRLRSIISNTREDDPSAPALLETHEGVRRLVANVNRAKAYHSNAIEMNRLANDIRNAPPFANNQRFILKKLEAYEVEKNAVKEDKGILLVLCNDRLLAARKRADRSGKLDEREGKSAYEFMFMAPVKGVDIKRLNQKAVRGKKETKLFAVELDPETTTVWHVNQSRALAEVLDEEGIRSSLVFAPRDQRTLDELMERFSEAKHQQYLSESSADIYLREVDGRHLYFHVFKQTDYSGWQHKNRVALHYTHQAPLPDLYHLCPEGETDALVVVQAMPTSFRWIVRTRECLVSSRDVFETLTEFHHAQVIAGPLLQALLNCHLLHHIYPPFTTQMELIMRQKLVEHVEPYSRSVTRKFRELVNRMHRTEPKSTEGAADDGASIDSIEQNKFFDDFAPENGKGEKGEEKKKKSTLGKMFGRFKSPLANIPE